MSSKDPVENAYNEIVNKYDAIVSDESTCFAITTPSKEVAGTIAIFPEWARAVTLGRFNLVQTNLNAIQVAKAAALALIDKAIVVLDGYQAVPPQCTAEASTAKLMVIDAEMLTLKTTSAAQLKLAKATVSEVEDFTIQFVSSEGSIVYGTDDRLDVGSLTNPSIQAVAKKVIVMIDGANEYLLPVDPANPKSDWAFSAEIQTVRQRLKICADDPTSYNDQPSAADCSGTAVGPDLVLTAAHCVLANASESVPAGQDPKAFYKLRDLSNTYVVFDYVLDTKTQSLLNLPFSSVWKVQEVVDYNYIGGISDWALVRVYNVSQTLEAAKTQKFYIDNTRLMDYYRTPEHFDNFDGTRGVFTIGSPSGAPLKFTGPAQIISPTLKLAIFAFINQGTTFGCMLNSTGGNSGGFVAFYDFKEMPNAVPKLLGVVVGSNPVKGQSDFTLDPRKRCNRVTVIPQIDSGPTGPKDPVTGLDIAGKIVIRVDAPYFSSPSIAATIDAAKIVSAKVPPLV